MLDNTLPISICQISSCLKEEGFEVELFDTTFYKWGEKSSTEIRIEALQFKPCPIRYKNNNLYQDFEAKLYNFQPDLIGFSVVEPTFNLSLKMLESVKDIVQKNDIKVAMGGVHTIMAPDSVIRFTNMVDFICIGEGEKAFIEICKKLKNGKNSKNQKGFWIRDDDSYVKNEKENLINLDQLPGLDFELFPSEYLEKPMMGKLYKTISIELTRGCPYNCTFCCDHSLTNFFRDKGRWFRKKSLDKIYQELREYVLRYNPQFVYMMSESFLAGEFNRINNFFKLYNDFKIPFWFNTRPEDITVEKAKLAKEAGCMRVSIGIESGNEQYRKKIMRRNISNKKIMETAAILRAHNISFSINLIIGLPDETREMIFESIEIARKCKPDAISTHIYSPYHGTEMRNLCVEKGYIHQDLIADDFFQGYYLKGNVLNEDELMGLFRTIPLYVNFPKSEYKRIESAEKLDDTGNMVFNELRKEFYQIMGW